MRVLLDTHVFLWANAEPDRLGARRAVIEDDRNELLVSAATAWEIAIKSALGRLHLPEPPERYVPDRMRAMAATPLPIEHAHALAVAELPLLHADPFDRVLIAQARLLGVPIVTAGRWIQRYDVDVLAIEPSA